MEVSPGYKKTELGVIPEDWHASSLNAVCSMKSGEGITSAGIDTFSPYPCYGGNGIRGYTSRFTHDGDYALIGRQGALCGNVVGATGKFFASEHAVVVTPKAGADIRFLTYVLGEMRLNRYSESSAQPGVSVSKILTLLVATPPTEGEQRAIAAALSDMDALLDGLDRLIAKKRDLKQATLQQLLKGRTRLPGFHGRWDVKRLKSVLSFQVGYPFSSTFFNSGGIGTRLVKNRDLKSDDQVFHYSGKYDSAYLVNDGDLLIGMDGDFRPCLWTKGAALLNQRVGRIVPLAGMDRVFAFYYLLGPLKEIEATTSSTTVKHLSHADIEDIESPLPSKSEQVAIAAILSDMDAELSGLEVRRDKTRAVKQAMMQELLTGRTRLI